MGGRRSLGAFEARLRVRERRHPKLYFFDPGAVRALKRQLGPLAAEERGALLEGLVFMLLRFYAERAELCDSITYWAPAEARTTDVDFVLSRGRQALAVEVKNAKAVRPSDLRGLRAIASLPGLIRRVLVFLRPRALLTPDGIDVWPFDRFVESLAEDSLWP